MQTKRNRLFVTLIAFLAFFMNPAGLSAQEQDPPEGYEYVDSLVYVKATGKDTTFVKMNVFELNVTQSDAIANSLRHHMRVNPGRKISGYRVRVFFDNKQTARDASSSAYGLASKLCPGGRVYRTYTNPYFKVTVGDCRTRSEAAELLHKMKKSFPNAFIVKDDIKFPPINKSHAHDIDTVRVLRPIVSQ